VHRGFPPVMPTYQGLLPAPEAAAIVAFIKSLGNVRAAAFTAPLPAGPLPIAPVREGTEPGSAAARQPAPVRPIPAAAPPAGGGNP
jgi:hypothetical protein